MLQGGGGRGAISADNRTDAPCPIMWPDYVSLSFIEEHSYQNWNTTTYTTSQRVVVVVLLFYVHGKHLRSCRDGQLT